MMDHSITLGSIIGILTVISVGVALVMHGRKVRRENEADARARTDELKGEIRIHNDSVEKRLTTLETKSADFMPRAEIEGKIEHEKGNRQQADNALKTRVDRHDDVLTAIQVDVGKIGEKHGSLAATMEEVKVLLKEQGRDFGARLDKIADAVVQSRAA